MWMHRIRLRVFALLVALVLAAVGVVSFAAVPVWPVIGVAFATMALAVNTITSRLNNPVCWGCGADVSKSPSGEYGVICPHCGALTEKPGPESPEPTEKS
jgi:hypothetical protein